MEKSLKSIATNYGLYLGVLMALLTVISYAVNLELLTNMWYGIFILIAVIVVGIISVAKLKQAQDGFASCKEAFSAYFITIIIGTTSASSRPTTSTDSCVVINSGGVHLFAL